MMSEAEYYKMAKAERRHWWYRSLHHLVLSAIKEHAVSRNLTIIDAGCGTGGLISFLKNEGYAHLRGFDASPVAVQICRQQYPDVFQGDLNHICQYFDKDGADVVVCNDVLYFLDEVEQRHATDAIHDLLKYRGLMICNLPAMKAFDGIHNISVGIKKRFEHEQLWQLFDPARYELVKEVYWPFILSPAIWISRWKQRMQLRWNHPATATSDVQEENTLLNVLLLFITRAENKLFSKKPWGSSLFLVLRKK